MRFILYKGLKKYIIENAYIPQLEYLTQLAQQTGKSEVSLSDSDLFDFSIIAESCLDEQFIAQEEAREQADGISWKQETVN